MQSVGRAGLSAWPMPQFPGPGALCPGGLSWILATPGGGLKRRPQHSSEERGCSEPGGGPARPWPRGPQDTASLLGTVAAPEVPGCGLRLTAEGRALCKVSTEPAPCSKQLGPRMGLSSLLPPCCSACRAIWKAPPGCGGPEPSVDSSRKPLACWEPSLALLPSPAQGQQ